jgi:hypothetical protein
MRKSCTFFDTKAVRNFDTKALYIFGTKALSKRYESPVHFWYESCEKFWYESLVKAIRKPCQVFNTKPLSNFEYESPVKLWIRKPCQTLNTKAQLFLKFYWAFVTNRYELIPSRPKSPCGKFTWITLKQFRRFIYFF